MYEGRGWDTQGAHTYGYNSVSIGIVFIGEFSNRKPNRAALNAAKQLISYGVSTVVVVCFCATLPCHLEAQWRRHTAYRMRKRVRTYPLSEK